jgi:enoyl-CoA hydratase/carnithine racemase
MKTDEFKEILYEKDENSGLVTLTLNTPKRKNALSPYTFLELFWAVDALENDETAYAMLITGAKDPESNDPTKEAFSSGGYFHPKAMEGVPEELMEQIDMSDIAQKKVTMKMFGCDKPIVAAINGLVVGGAFTMCLSGVDLIYMSEHAWFRLPFNSLGIIAELASSYFLPRMVGMQKAKEIVYFSKTVPAQEAFELGLINAVVPHDKLIPFAVEKTLELMPPKGANFAVRQMKQAFHQPFIDIVSKALDKENEGLRTCFNTGDFFEGIAAMQQKRDPVFKGS